MKLLQFTDLHNHSDFIKKLEEEIRQADGIILSGDITTFGPVGIAKDVMDAIQKLNTRLMVIPGNCDTDEVKAYTEEKEVSIDRRVIALDEYQIAGIGGSLPCPTQTPNQYTEEVFQNDFKEIALALEEGKPLILVAHHPPFQTKNDRVATGLHVGSKSVRSFIETYQPLVCLSGHIHEGVGVDKIGKTFVVNPGPAMDGCYAEIHLSGDQVDIVLKSL